MSDAELEAFKQEIGEMGNRVTEFLVEGTDRTPEDLKAAVADLSKPDPTDDRPVDKCN